MTEAATRSDAAEGWLYARLRENETGVTTAPTVQVLALDRTLEYVTIPAEAEVQQRMSWATPGVITDTNYFAAYVPNALTAEECEEIIASGVGGPLQQAWPWCEATGHELRGTSYGTQVLATVTHEVTSKVWPTYEYVPELSARLQSYVPGQGYPLHIDGGPGSVNWKIIVVALVSDETTYEGGDLVLDLPTGQRIQVPRERGGIVVFQPNLQHHVTPVTSGERHTVNAGFWGPAWR